MFRANDKTYDKNADIAPPLSFLFLKKRREKMTATEKSVWAAEIPYLDVDAETLFLKREFHESGKDGRRKYEYYVSGIIKGKPVKAHVGPKGKGSHNRLARVFKGADSVRIVKSDEYYLVDTDIAAYEVYTAVNHDAEGNILKATVRPWKYTDKVLLDMLFRPDAAHIYEALAGNWKVTHNGSHYVGHKPTQDPCRGKRHPRDKSLDDVLNTYYIEGRKAGLKKERLVQYMVNSVTEEYDTIKNIDAVVNNFVERKKISIHERCRRFQQKADMNPWTHFATFTYDDTKHDEASFKEKLKRTLSGFSSRRGWRYMGVWERSQDGRLHFHALLHIPHGQMVGNFSFAYDYSFGRRKTQKVNQNSFFLDSYGRNDFVPIAKVWRGELHRIVNYILKYIGESEESILHSHGSPAYIEITADDGDIVMGFFDFVLKCIFYDDVFASRYSDKRKPPT